MPNGCLEKGVKARLAITGLVLAANCAFLPSAHAQTIADLRGQVGDNVLGAGVDDSDPLRVIPAPSAADVSNGGFIPQRRPTDAVADDDGPDDLFSISEDEASPFGDDPFASGDTDDDDAIADLITTGAIGDQDSGARSLAVQPVGPLVGTGGRPEDDPFAPPGLRLGTFDVNVTLDLGTRWTRDTNTSGDGGTPPVFIETETSGFTGEAALDLQARSDWSRHALDLSLAGTGPVSLSGDVEIDPEFEGSASLRLDLADQMTLRLTGTYSFDRVDPEASEVFSLIDPVNQPDLFIDGDSDRHIVTGEAELSRSLGLTSLTGAANIERQFNGDARLTDGTSISQDELDFTRYGGRLRAGYSVSPLFAPFVQGEISQRAMDRRPDSAGLDRNALRYVLSAGVAYDGGEKLRGELALGYIREDIADDSLADIAGLSISGNLNWSPRRETDVALNLSTSTRTSAAADTSGALSYSSTLAVTHSARSNLDLTGEIRGSYEDVVGAEADTFTAGGTVGATYWFNRFAGLTGRVGYDQTFSSDPGERESATSAFIGVRLQR